MYASLKNDVRCYTQLELTRITTNGVVLKRENAIFSKQSSLEEISKRLSEKSPSILEFGGRL